jgi:hypothetical protein
MKEQKFVLEFEGLSRSEANMYAGELRDLLQQATREATVEQTQSGSNVQDFGASILIGILGTQAVVALANKIGDWMVRRRSASITIKTASGEIVVQNVTSKDATTLAEEWLKQVRVED